MLQSMTGFATATRELEGASLTIELRSVNSRFLDIAFRVPDDLRAAEPPLRDQITAALARGKIDCRLQYSIDPTHTLPANLDQRVLERLVALSAQVTRALPEARPLAVADVLAWPGVIAGRGDAFEALRAAAPGLMQQALRDLVASRAREGARLGAMICERTAQIRTGLAVIAPLIPQSVAAWQARLGERLREALAGAEEDRIRQEVALFGVKIDVAEEFSRLAVHLDEIDRLCGAGTAVVADAPAASLAARSQPVGKRLDFLMQELNRETNTLGSKSVSRDISNGVIDFKVLIEQMREQVQNLE
jgi:uncharacterized protein (TIGR00255 family)